MSALLAVARLCTVSRLSWNAAVNAASPEQAMAVEVAAETALDAWHDALELVEAGDLAGARSELLEARWQAAQWGDDATERRALDVVQEACQ